MTKCVARCHNAATFHLRGKIHRARTRQKFVRFAAGYVRGGGSAPPSPSLLRRYGPRRPPVEGFTLPRPWRLPLPLHCSAGSRSEQPCHPRKGDQRSMRAVTSPDIGSATASLLNAEIELLNRSASPNRMTLALVVLDQGHQCRKIQCLRAMWDRFCK